MALALSLEQATLRRLGNPILFSCLVVMQCVPFRPGTHGPRQCEQSL